MRGRSRFLQRLRHLSPASGRRIRFAASFLLACLVAWGMEVLGERAIESGDHASAGLAPSVFGLSGLYQRLVASGPRKPAPSYTSIVVIDPKTDPTLYDVCEQRRFLANVLRATAALHPAVIVIDKYFSLPCHDRPAGTRELQEALRDVTRQIPVVIGRRVAAHDGASGHSWPVLEPALPLGAGLPVLEGIVNIERDTRRLPLGWTVRADAGATAAWYPTIPLQAAEAYDPKLRVKHPLLDRLISGRQSPYISFLRLEDLQTYARYAAQDVLCTAGSAPSCAGRPPADVRLRNRIVLIAELNWDFDSHLSVLGRVPGFVLQANYIEALLDQRFFRPLPWWANYLVGFLIFVAFHWVLVSHDHALRAAHGWGTALVLTRAAGWSAAIIVGTILAIYVIVMHTGWYVNPATIGVLAFVLNLGELVIAALAREEAGHEKRSSGSGVDPAHRDEHDVGFDGTGGPT